LRRRGEVHRRGGPPRRGRVGGIRGRSDDRIGGRIRFVAAGDRGGRERRGLRRRIIVEEGVAGSGNDGREFDVEHRRRRRLGHRRRSPDAGGGTEGRRGSRALRSPVQIVGVRRRSRDDDGRCQDVRVVGGLREDGGRRRVAFIFIFKFIFKFIFIGDVGSVIVSNVRRDVGIRDIAAACRRRARGGIPIRIGRWRRRHVVRATVVIDILVVIVHRFFSVVILCFVVTPLRVLRTPRNIPVAPAIGIHRAHLPLARQTPQRVVHARRQHVIAIAEPLPTALLLRPEQILSRHGGICGVFDRRRRRRRAPLEGFGPQRIVHVGRFRRRERRGG